MQVGFLGQEDPLEKEMATHFRILEVNPGNPMDRGAWRAQYMGLQRIGQDLVTK